MQQCTHEPVNRPKDTFQKSSLKSLKSYWQISRARPISGKLIHQKRISNQIISKSGNDPDRILGKLIQIWISIS